MNNIALEKKITTAMHSLLYRKGYISSVDLLIELEYLSKKDYEDWRKGKVAFLEKLCRVNLKKLSFIQKTIKRFAEQKKLKKSVTVYNQWGAKSKKRLIFSKSGNSNIEKLYATHFLDNKRIEELKE